MRKIILTLMLALGITTASTVEAQTPVKGKQKALVILVNFWDVKFQTANDKALYEQILNGKDFKNDMGFVGSVNDYFRAMSNGEFEFEFDVYGPVQLDNNRSYYGKDEGISIDKNLGSMIKEACEYGKMDCKINFADYDTDKDGEVDLVAVIFPGQGSNASYESDAADYICPQEGKLSNTFSNVKPFTLDGVTIDKFACSCELNVGKTIDGIGVLCHEFSHSLGLHDMYDTSGNGYYGMSIWSIMDMGNYLGGTFIPASYTAYERMCLGWRMPTVLKNDTVVTNMKAIEDGGETFIIYNEGNKDEFYLLENRQPVGWDAGLNYGNYNYGSGLLITHVDYDKATWDANNINSSEHQRCTIFHADGSDGKQTLNDVAGDPYPYNKNGIINNQLTNTSSPAAWLYNANSDGTKLMNIAITNITQNSDGTISFKFSGSGSTGIDGVIANNNSLNGKKIYSLDGRFMGTEFNALSKGIYVVNGIKIIK